MDLTELILTPPARLDAAVRAVQHAAVACLAGSGWRLVDAPAPWRRPADPHWWARLLELAGSAAALLPMPLAADLGRGRPLDDLPDAALVPVLAAELAAGTLWRRRFQSEDLAAALAVPGVFGVLAAALTTDELDAAWADPALLGNDPRHLARVAAAVLADPAALAPRWRGLLHELLGRLDALAQAPDAALAAALEQALDGLALPGDLDLLRALLALRARGATVSMLPAGLRGAAAGLADPAAQQWLLDALAGQPGGLAACGLIEADGALALPWLNQYAARLLADPAVRERLGVATLLALAPAAPAVVGATLDARMTADPAATTGALIATAGWEAWRDWPGRAAAPGPGWPGLAALWLTHPAH
ncbi:MAG: hypothetical protein EA400_18445, partial [Chromatiaceae bacterium]